jgi:L-serine/L-threonine ammonia-lyase
MIQEMSSDLEVKPDAIFCSVGGAGLLAGIMVGCEMVGWDDGNYMATHESSGRLY